MLTYHSDNPQMAAPVRYIRAGLNVLSKICACMLLFTVALYVLYDNHMI